MSLADPNLFPFEWMPVDMLTSDKQQFAARHPQDPHRAAADAWEAWSATLPVATTGSDATSVSTGAQSVSLSGLGVASGAMGRANYHRARARVRSVRVGPAHTTHDVGVSCDCPPGP